MSRRHHDSHWWIGPRLVVVLSLVIGLASCAGRAAAQDAAIHSPGGGKVYALVIGIDHYQHSRIAPVLQGAVADARDLSATLRRLHTNEVVTLIDEQATRQRVVAALQRFERIATGGDLVIFTFAGHGAIQKTRYPAITPSGFDQLMLLWGIGDTDEAAQEQLVDKQIYLHLKALTKSGARVLFLADTCYGGGLSKAGNLQAASEGVRGLVRVDRPEDAAPGSYYIPPSADEVALPPLPPGEDATADLPQLTFIAAVEPTTTAPEISISGQPGKRGAASYALARALEGAAHAPGGGNTVTNRVELTMYIRRMVRQLTGNRQSPIVEPTLPATALEPVFALVGPGQTASLDRSKHPSEAPAAGKAGPNSLAPEFETPPLLVYNQASRSFVDQVSRLTYAYEIDQSGRQDVVNRVGLGRKLAEIASKQPALDIRLSPAERIYRSGQGIDLSVQNAWGRYLTILDISGNGEIGYLFPEAGTDSFIPKPSIMVPLNVGPPYGHDLLVVLATKQDVRQLQAELKQLNGLHNAESLIRILQASLGADDQVGLIPYWTSPH